MPPLDPAKDRDLALTALLSAMRVPAPPWIRFDLGRCYIPRRAADLDLDRQRPTPVPGVTRPRLRKGLTRAVLRATFRPQKHKAQIAAHLCGRDLCFAPSHLTWLTRNELRLYDHRFLAAARKHAARLPQDHQLPFLWNTQTLQIADHLDALRFIKPTP